MTRLVLRLLPPDIAGDLQEEFGADLRSLRCQILRSLPSLAWVRISRHYGAVAAVAVAMAGYDRLWAYVLSQVPLKASDARGLEFWVIEAFAGLAAAWIAGRARGKGRIA